MNPLASTPVLTWHQIRENEKHRTYKATHFTVYTILKFSNEACVVSVQKGRNECLAVHYQQLR
jgi:hypothetical protein